MRIGLIFLFLASSCRLSDKKPPSVDLTPLQTANMTKALELVKSGEFLKAAQLYDQLAREQRGKPSEVVFLFNGGSSYREGGDCTRSVQRYQRLLDISFKEPLFKARGLVEISYSYECLGDIKAGYLALSDANSLRGHLPENFQRAIYPARLSLAHARFQQFDKADSYQSLALNGILQLKMEYPSEEALKKGLSRIFYDMGRIHLRQSAHLEPEAFISAFPYHQLYLLQALFLRDDFWSERAEKELLEAFKNLHLSFVRKKSLKVQYKDYILLSLKEGRILVEKEKPPGLKSFYIKESSKIRSLF